MLRHDGEPGPVAHTSIRTSVCGAVTAGCGALCTVIVGFASPAVWSKAVKSPPLPGERTNDKVTPISRVPVDVRLKIPVYGGKALSTTKSIGPETLTNSCPSILG